MVTDGESARMKGLLQVTELEGAVLAVVWEQGPCSPYAVLKEFRDSPTPEWSASAGAIYPVIARLEGRKLIESRREQWGKRGKKMLSIAPAGLEAVRAWVADIAGKAGDLPLDPVRTRIAFIESLPSTETKLEILANGEESARALLDRLRTGPLVRAGSDLAAIIATEGAIQAVKARIEWLASARKQLKAEVKIKE